jgi:hypothetical protein
MAEIQDLDGSEVGELEVVEKQQQETEQKSAVADSFDLPDKYRGKNVADIVKMHQEAEKLIERQGREVGEVRKLADELIKSQLTPKREAVEQRNEVDFFENPQEAIRQQIENNPRVQAAEHYARQAQMEQARQQFTQMHPDAQQIIQDEGFKNWVGASRVRQQLFNQADKFDLDAANELLSTYKELKSVRQQKVMEVDNTSRNQSLRAAAVETGGSGESTRKVFRRADLIRLKMRDPSKYEAMQDEIYAAYAEGRIK